MLVSVMASLVPGLTPTTKVGNVTSEQWDALYSGPWRRWLEVIGDGGATASQDGDQTLGSDAGCGVGGGSDYRASDSPVPNTAWISEDGASYYPTTLAERLGDEGESAGAEMIEGGDSGSTGAAVSSLQDVMATYYRATQSNEEFDGLRRRCLARITGTLVKLRERAAEFEAQLAAAQEDKVCFWGSACQEVLRVCVIARVGVWCLWLKIGGFFCIPTLGTFLCAYHDLPEGS